MITFVGEHDLLLTPEGFLTPSEIGNDVPVVGIDKLGTHKPVKVSFTECPKMEDSYVLYTSQSEIALTSETQLYPEGLDHRAALLISKIIEDKYGDQIFVSISNSVPSSCRFLRRRYEWDYEIELTKDTAYIFGAMVRRIPQFSDRIVLRTMSVNGKRLLRELEHRFSNSKSVGKSKMKLIDGDTWSWIKIDSPRLLAALKSLWPNPNEIPQPFRSFEKPLFGRWFDGAKLACSQNEDETSVFTFLEERQLRQMICYYQILVQDGYDYQPQPRYMPMDVSIRLGGIEEASARVLSITKTNERAYRLEVNEPYWSPVVNSILLKTVQQA
jgi:hypothetical protein